jgi:hypothetical protein
LGRGLSAVQHISRALSNLIQKITMTECLHNRLLPKLVLLVVLAIKLINLLSVYLNEIEVYFVRI